jgi:hypothetical protein
MGHDSSVSIVTGLDLDGRVSILYKDIYDLCTDSIRGPPEPSGQSVKLTSIPWSD